MNREELDNHREALASPYKDNPNYDNHEDDYDYVLDFNPNKPTPGYHNPDEYPDYYPEFRPHWNEDNDAHGVYFVDYANAIPSVISTGETKDHKACNNCGQIFYSGNALHSHLAKCVQKTIEKLEHKVQMVGPVKEHGKDV
jgi:hypothetical protein